MEPTNNKAKLTAKMKDYLEVLCLKIPNRHVGSPGNRQATEFFARTVASFGFETEMPQFACIDWAYGEVYLQAGAETFEALAGPYSPPYDSTAPLVVVSSLDELQNKDSTAKIMLIRGELAGEQLMPKNFPFYNPEHHQQIISLLEQKQPAAIIAATTRNPELAGGLYPFPLIEDGDFDIPSVYMTAEEGQRLLEYQGNDITLGIESERIPTRGCNVVARKGTDLSERIVICAHIDAKKDTPGAIDNGTGVVTLLALAELLGDYSGRRCVEIVALNGEDYYAASGQLQYLALNEGQYETILVAINMDAAGYHQANTMYSLFGCPEPMARTLHEIFGGRYRFEEGEPWYQSDHSIFIAQQRPAVAITSTNLMELSTHITHTEKDTPDIIDCHKLADIAYGLRDVVLSL